MTRLSTSSNDSFALCVNGSFLDIKNYNYSHILRKKLLIPVMIHERYQYVRKLKLGLFIVLFSPLFLIGSVIIEIFEDSSRL